MEINELIQQTISSYRYAGIYIIFVIDTLGVFMPSKSILTITGLLVQSGQLEFIPLFISAFTGSLTGFLISYTIGLKLGKPFILKYGKHIKITASNIDRAEKWFKKHGPVFIILAYFTPGLRHITPYICGLSGMKFTKVIIFAGLGSALWITVFVSLGRYLGSYSHLILDLLDRYRWEAITSFVLVIFLFFSYRYLLKVKS